MTKSELVERVACKMTALTKKETEMIVNAVFDSMTEALSQGERIEIRGVGSFKVKQRNARDGRNPKTGKNITIPPRKVPFFKVGKELKKMINS
ncbi:MAG: integration host factor subunit beta [Thermodesulfobacteriota bacterium]